MDGREHESVIEVPQILHTIASARNSLQRKIYGDPLPAAEIEGFKDRVTGELDVSWRTFDGQVHDHGFLSTARELLIHYALRGDKDNPVLYELILSRQKADSSIYDAAVLAVHTNYNPTLRSPGKHIMMVSLGAMGEPVPPMVYDGRESEVYALEALCGAQGINLRALLRDPRFQDSEIYQSLVKAGDVFRRPISEKDRDNFMLMLSVLSDGERVDSKGQLEGLKKEVLVQSTNMGDRVSTIQGFPQDLGEKDRLVGVSPKVGSRAPLVEVDRSTQSEGQMTRPDTPNPPKDPAMERALRALRDDPRFKVTERKKKN